MTWIALIALIGWTFSSVGWWITMRLARRERAERLEQQQRIDAAAEGLTRKTLVRP